MSKYSRLIPNLGPNVNRWEIHSGYKGCMFGEFTEGTFRLQFAPLKNFVAFLWTGQSMTTEISFIVKLKVEDGRGEIFPEQSWVVTNLKCGKTVNLTDLPAFGNRPNYYADWTYVDAQIFDLTRTGNSGRAARAYYITREQRGLTSRHVPSAANVEADQTAVGEVPNAEKRRLMTLRAERFSLSDYDIDVDRRSANVSVNSSTNSSSANVASVGYDIPATHTQIFCYCQHPNCTFNLSDYKPRIQQVQRVNQSDLSKAIADAKRIRSINDRPDVSFSYGDFDAIPSETAQPPPKRQKVGLLPTPIINLIDAESAVPAVINRPISVAKVPLIPVRNDNQINRVAADEPHLYPGWAVDFPDFTLISDDNWAFPISRAILSLKSAVFKADLSTDAAKRDGRAKITFRGEVLLELLKFLCGQDFTENLAVVAVELMRAAEHYQLPQLKCICEEQVAQQLSFDTLTFTIRLADEFNSDMLMAKCFQFIKKRKANEKMWEDLNLHLQLPKILAQINVFSNSGKAAKLPKFRFSSEIN